jgi:hypothetical protein
VGLLFHQKCCLTKEPDLTAYLTKAQPLALMFLRGLGMLLISSRPCRAVMLDMRQIRVGQFEQAVRVPIASAQ